VRPVLARVRTWSVKTVCGVPVAGVTTVVDGVELAAVGTVELAIPEHADASAAASSATAGTSLSTISSVAAN
jgi:hypothetical protein